MDVPSFKIAATAQQLFGAELPQLEEQGRIEMPVEVLDPGARQKPEIKLELVEAPPTPRLWFVSDVGDELVQVQDDFFARNWRRRDEGGSPYPRYVGLRGPFVDGYTRLSDALAKQNESPPLPIQCEVTYVNTILPGEGWRDHGDVHKVIRVVKPGKTAFLPRPESVQVVWRFLLPAGEKEKIGRLYITAQPAFRQSDQGPAILLTLTARGKPIGEGIAGVVRFMDMGHESIVRAFAEVTTEGMQQVWRRIDGR
jgi:uncharacterized protein (TIGR04255 family)